MTADSIQHDAPRTAVDSANALVARLRASERPCVLFVGHAMGGGVQRHMDDLAALLAPECHVLWAQPGPGATLEIGARDDEGAFTAYFALPAEMPALLALLRGVGVARLHIHHLHGLPRAILELIDALELPHDITLHDYYGMHPDGVWRPGDDAPTHASYLDDAIPPGGVPWDLSLAQWRDCFRELIARADRVIAPSQDVAQRYRRMWPGVDIVVKPHPEAPAASLRAVARIVAPGRLSPE
ncbi:MAG TPA: glycosyltransferase, partial [Casimicrobiaceae bacterium]|nr:glycosyltransferase [Casimicrobiaceae bacterium]